MKGKAETGRAEVPEWVIGDPDPNSADDMSALYVTLSTLAEDFLNGMLYFLSR
jgi:hypothetical protein